MKMTDEKCNFFFQFLVFICYSCCFSDNFAAFDLVNLLDLVGLVNLLDLLNLVLFT